MTRVIAPSRLHFGLLSVPTPKSTPTIANQLTKAQRQFGGVGLMIDRPGVVVSVRAADTWRVEGTLASRAQVIAHRFFASMADEIRRPFHILIEQSPPEHTGLGVGTQLGLAIARGLAAELGMEQVSAVDLAARIGRGERSAIGVHGFAGGGLIMEPGKLPGDSISPLLHRLRLPPAWRIVLFLSPTASDWHGLREREAFAQMTLKDADVVSNSLQFISTHAIVPAAQAGDLDRFGEAVHEFNRLAGEPFTTCQGGPYSSVEVSELIAQIRRAGVKGVGQSSWGPTVFAIVGSEEDAVSLIHRVRGHIKPLIAQVSSGVRIESPE